MIWSILSTQIALKPLPIDSPDSGVELKKNPIGKYFFIMEKNDFEIFDFQKKSKSLIFSIEKSIFSIEKPRFFKQNFQNHFSPRKKKFFDQIFFPASGDVHTSRLYAQSGLGVTLPRRTSLFVQNPAVTTFFWKAFHMSCM